MNPEEFFNSLVDYEKIPGYDYKLEDFIEFLTQFDSPQKRLNNVIHIAGTKGKGSTAAMISSCLEACGYRVGLFTSPHLKRINERIKINNFEISNRDLMKYIKQIKPYIKGKHGTRPVKYRKLPGAPSIKYHKFHGARTFFEILTTIAFLHFLKKKTDFTILEVGLGGRLDSTNVTNPIISVITRIGYDHTNLLGNKLSQIAREKAGIIKNCGKLITIKQRPTVQKIIEKICREKSCSLSLAESQHDIKIVRQIIKGSHLKIKGEIGTFNTFLPLPGKHQVENLLIALAVINELGKMGFKIPVSAIQKGIRQTDLHGRFEIISKKPLIIFDCAHNQDSFEALGKNLNLVNTKDLYLIFGTNKDKDIRYCLKYIFPRAKEVLLVKADNPRAMEPIDLYERAKKYQKNLIVAPSVQKAIEYIKTKTHHNPTILITGSFYLWQPTW
ncbi:MAG: folylpolyglutamate synthase/dihydrofolate synthase family protein [bacterium]